MCIRDRVFSARMPLAMPVPLNCSVFANLRPFACKRLAAIAGWLSSLTLGLTVVRIGMSGGLQWVVFGPLTEAGHPSSKPMFDNQMNGRADHFSDRLISGPNALQLSDLLTWSC